MSRMFNMFVYLRETNRVSSHSWRPLAFGGIVSSILPMSASLPGIVQKARKIATMYAVRVAVRHVQLVWVRYVQLTESREISLAAHPNSYLPKVESPFRRHPSSPYSGLGVMPRR